MAFFSKLDNKSFTNKEDLIQHIVQHYVVEIQEGTQEKIIQKIQEQLPFVDHETNKTEGKQLAVIKKKVGRPKGSKDKVPSPNRRGRVPGSHNKSKEKENLILEEANKNFKTE